MIWKGGVKQYGNQEIGLGYDPEGDYRRGFGHCRRPGRECDESVMVY